MVNISGFVVQQTFLYLIIKYTSTLQNCFEDTVTVYPFSKTAFTDGDIFRIFARKNSTTFFAVKILAPLDCSSRAHSLTVLLNTKSEHLAPFVYLLFTYITSTLSWPDIWKCAFVTPVHKKVSRSDIQNYRPISILPRLSLIFEKLLFDLIYRKLRNKINYRQHGFQRGKPTGTQLIDFLDELYQNSDINEEQIVVYLDIQKAFDSVSHATLLDKLSKFGFDDSLLRLIHSYLTCRKQRVRIDDPLSTVGEVSSGDPQGSVVGPLFYLLYIDDMLALPKFSHCYCFADDTKICSSVDPEKLQSDLSTVFLWAYDNQMTFHKDKCCYLHFQKTKAYHLVLGHQILQEKSRAVNLDVTILNDLSQNARTCQCD